LVATVRVVQAHGGGDGAPSYSPASGDATIRFHTADQYNPTDTTKPIPIPGSGFKYSYWVHVCLDLSGTFTKINNVRHYSDGAIGWTLGTGGELRRGARDTGDQGCPMDTEYDVATGVEGDSGDPIEDPTNGHGYYNTQTTPTADVANDTEASPAMIDSTDHTVAGKTKAVVLQVKVASDATQGDQPDETLTWKYDEI
jgi:hypothetical protein